MKPITIRTLLPGLLIWLNINPAHSQTYVTAPMNGTYTSGEYVNGTSITLSPNTTITPGSGQTVYIHTTLSSCAPLALNLSASLNYVLTSTPRIPGYNPAATGYTTCDVMQAVQYIDGLGRPIQTVQVKGSPDASRDVVQPMAYDQYGREPVKYLPYTSASADGSYKPSALSGEQSGFYNSPPAGVTTIPSPYSQTVYDGSPLNRMVEQGAPGNPWQPGNHTMKMDYLTNNSITWANDPVNSRLALIYTATTNADLSRTIFGDASVHYGDNYLTVTVSKDENWTSGRGNTTEEYKDLEGRTILKRTYNYAGTTLQKLSTYYVYDDTGNLVFVLPPGADPDNAPLSQTTLDNFCYQYQYDELNRLVQKKLPGKGWEYMIYNAMDRLVATQDANQRAVGNWTFTKYDGLGRVVQTGICNYTTDRATLQAGVNTYTTYWENAQNSGNGYTFNAFPTSNITATFSLNYYDNYASIPGLPGYTVPAGAATAVNSLQTASRVTILNPDGSYGPMLWSISYYDDKARNIAAYQQHYLNATANQSNYDLVTTTYNNITNEVTATNRNHYTTAGTSPAVSIAITYTYDHMGRKRQTTEQINGGAATVISQTDYNDVGQLMNKHVGNNLQNISYAYNERGWMHTAATSGNLFNLDLRYDAPDAGITPQYNGNIAEMLYTGQNSGSKTFSYTYDMLNRLTAAQSTNGTLNETNISYDVLGNIQGLTRGSYGSLGYTYTGNQLNTVTGYSPRTYAYDANGNATSDGAITNAKNITYNYLNLPATVGSVATYTYDATGNKLHNTGSDGSWDYINGITYFNNAIKYITTEEGRATPNGGGYTYQYDLKDHLGDVRVTFDQYNNAVRVLQEDEYYAFGLRKSDYDYSNNNRHLYNGKELQVDLANQYDYGARFYDPVIARWTTPDPLAEISRKYSPYVYAYNNPIRNVDPDGMWTTDANGNSFTDDPDDIASFIQQSKAQQQDKHPLQSASDGYGDLIKRHYGATVKDSKKSAKSMFEQIRSDFSSFVEGQSYFEDITRDGEMQQGDEVSVVGGPGYGVSKATDEVEKVAPQYVDANGNLHTGTIKTGVTVINISESKDSYSMTFQTWKGHVEAGTITFNVKQLSSGKVELDINSNARNSNFFTNLAYKVGGKSAQTEHWNTFLNNFVKATGGTVVQKTIK